LLAVPWFVLATTGSAAQAGVVAFFSFLPLAAAAFVGGHVVDRFGARRTSVCADIASALTALGIPAAHALDVLSLPLVIALVFLGTALDGPGGTARRALLPEASDAAQWRLERVTSASEAAYRSAQLLGGVCAAGLIASVGAPAALAVNATTFAVSALLVGLGTLSLPPASAPVLPVRESLAEGVRFLRADPVLRAVIVLFLAVNMLENALIAVLLPAYAQSSGIGARALGLPVAALGAGALAGVLAWGALAPKYGLRRTLGWSLLLSGPPKYVVLAAGAPLSVVVLVFFVSSIAAGPINPVLSVLQLRRIPPVLRGRVLGAAMSGVVASIPAAVLVAGALAEAAGVAAALTAGAACYGLVTVWAVTTGPFRSDRPAGDDGARLNSLRLPLRRGTGPVRTERKEQQDGT
jgi:MFS family permease